MLPSIRVLLRSVAGFPDEEGRQQHNVRRSVVRHTVADSQVVRVVLKIWIENVDVV